MFDPGCTMTNSGNGAQECSDYTHGSAPVTNTTACLDGFKDGWRHWCSANTKECTDEIRDGVFPGSPKLDHWQNLAD